VAAVLLIVGGVHEPAALRTSGPPQRPFTRRELVRMGGPFWGAVGVATLMTLARFSEAFLILRAGSVGLAPELAPVVLVVMNVVYGATAYPVGYLSDRLGRRGLLGAGLAVLVAADLVLALAGPVGLVLVGSGVWGFHMGMTQGLLATVVAESAPQALRGTAFGLFNLTTGITLLAANVLAGALWAILGPAGTFGAGAAFSAVAVLGLPLMTRTPAPLPRGG
jgi:MFS family permease